ncbi:heme ABC transporter ATP-binding protein [Demequina sp. SYSU T00192]|uniref:Heme ABC transporter ATP-binding protein n=1 Tax=Demequina litoralis TaxID=3051660 RepID=A0ABT8G9N1_9MICO|nr:heme ABC transporter ATP-binding protein [Demequina sp. SYSU T00192]MDN4475836.1 heme ABC transporter ATP-binding protein [Demequina sp. SYSU T00192]
MTAAIHARDVTVRAGDAALVDSVTLDVRHGELLALVGPNGAGKSTLLSALSGERSLAGGLVELDGRPLSAWQPGPLARERAVLTQDNQVAFPFTVAEVVAMGRAPWRGRPESDEDDAVIAESLARADVAHLAGRAFPSLSGGERARVSLARVLAQRTRIVMLDEPTAALDIRHQEEVFALARELARAGAAVVVVVHDLSLAAAYADRIAVLDRARLAGMGSPREVLVPELLERVYGLGVRVIEDPDTGLPVVLPRR